MDIPLPDTSELMDARGEIITDLPCRRCSYNLRGLHKDGLCPECATPVGRSTHGDLLCYSDPNWVHTLSRGTRVILIGVLIGIIVGAVGGFLMVALGSALYLHVAMLLAACIGFYGTWLLTEPDPSQIGEDVYGTARKLTRITLFIGVVSILLMVVADGIPLQPTMAMALTLIIMAASLVGVVGEYARLYYLEKLSVRVPHPDAEKRARFLRWALPISLLATLMAYWVQAVILAANPAAAPGSAFTGVACFVRVAHFIFVIMYLLLLHKLGKEFREKAAIARALWNPASSTPAVNGAS